MSYALFYALLYSGQNYHKLASFFAHRVIRLASLVKILRQNLLHIPNLKCHHLKILPHPYRKMAGHLPNYIARAANYSSYRRFYIFSPHIF